MEYPTIKMVDLQKQYVRLKNEIDAEMNKVLDSAIYLKGEQVKQFEQDLATFLQTSEVIACANGTDALTIALMALELSPGDEVIVPDFTFIASAEAIAFLGLKPVFVSCSKDSFLIDMNAVKNAITAKTKAIIPVHLFGQCANMEEIMNLAQQHQLYVIEDNAQAIGADFTFSNGKIQKVGTMGHIGTTSFFPSKNLGCYGDGGAIFTNDAKLGKKLRSIANHGMEKPYSHSIVGMNSRLDEIQAAVLKVKLKHLDSFNSARNFAASFYDSALSEISEIGLPKRIANSTHVFHQYTIKVEKRNELKAYLMKNGIPSMIYYPIPLHQQEAFSKLNCNVVSDTQILCDQVLALPMHSELTEQELMYITSTIKDFYQK